jgi:hypothetical protein
MAQSSEEARLGELGVTETCRNIERLGWGTTVNSRHDFGTDIFMLVLGPKGEDLRLIVGAQVKTGDSYFKEPRHSDTGELEGWWYRDRTRAHVDSWASHAVPHLIVLHDLETETSYWAHVTPESIVSTGVGAKVFVAKGNSIDDAHRADLEAVAAANRGGAYEGSAWTGKSPPSPGDALRYALIVPRLVAPHPNAGQAERLTADEGLALVVLDRLRHYERFAEEHRSVPTLEKARTSGRWNWRLVGALARWLFHQECGELLAAVASSSDPPGRAAASVLAAGALIESGELDRAASVLRESIAAGGYENVDRAWLQLQYARCCVEIGELETARNTALTAYGIRPHAGVDATAAALLGATAALIFNTSDWGAKALDDLIGAGDNAAVWWRSQTTRYGLDALAERNFKAWARETAITVGAEDQVEHSLESSALMASNAADHAGWRHLSSLRATSELMDLDRFATPEEAHVGLRRLMLAGDNASLKLAVRHLIADGPARAVTLAGDDLRLGQASHTSALAEITLLHQGGSMIETTTADQVVRWLLATLADPRAYGYRVTPTFALEWGLLDALSGVVGAAGLRAQRQVIRRIATLPPQRHQGPAHQWSRVLAALPARAWTEDLELRVKPRAGRHHQVLQVPLLGVAARRDGGARRSLHNRVTRGDLDSLSALGDVTKLLEPIAAQVIRQSARSVRRMIAGARTGKFGVGGNDPGEALVLLNVWHPKSARWKEVYDLLKEPAILAREKQRSLVVLANLVDQLPVSVCERLRPIALALARGEGVGLRSPFDPDQDVVGRAWNLAVLLGGIDLDEDATPMAELLGGDAEHRRWASFIAARLGRPADVGALAVLSNDPHPMVRGSAAWGLAAMLSDGKGGDLVGATLRRVVDDGGVWVPDAIAGALAEAERPGPVARELLMRVKEHPSSMVRATARGES